MKTILPFLLLFPCILFSQKEIYIPLEWQAGSLDYSLDRSAESENFIVFWGPLAGNDPNMAPADIAFNPQQILNTAEELYKFYIDTIQFLNDEAGLLSQYKIILVMLHTWTGVEGWAFGGNYDGVVGAMWMHPHAASSGPTLAHEFTHTLQNYAWMMNPGHGFIDSSYVGFFWETHAEFMALQRYPSVALEFDMARWLNTNHFHWSSTRHHYQAFVFLQFIKELDGITMINRLWSESIIGEHPLQTYMRLKDITQDELNDLFAQYAMKNVVWDYEIGDLLRERVSTLPPVFVSHPTIIPERIDSARSLYAIQNHLAPQDYGYNIIRLYPDTVQGCDKRVVHLNLRMQTIWPDWQQAGLKFGFVAVDENGGPRYSNIHNRGGEVSFELEDDETELYLVVVGAPAEHHNYHWEVGFPKIYRYPYEFILKNAVPEGYQKGFRRNQQVPGNQHVNGGGFVASTAFADPTAYIGPHAQVLDNAQVKENARIADYAIIQHSALVEDSAHVSGLAIVGESAHVYNNAKVLGQAHVFGDSEIFGDAVVTDNAQLFNTRVYENATITDNTFTWGATLYGDILLGGDAEFFTECSDGTYMQVEWAYNRNCDGLDNHPANVDVTEGFISPSLRNEYTLLCDSLADNVFVEIYATICDGELYDYNGQLLEFGYYEFVYERPGKSDSIEIIYFDKYPNFTHVFDTEICEGDTIAFETFIWQGDTVATYPGTHEFFEEGFHTVYYLYGDNCLDSFTFELTFMDVDVTVEQNGDQLIAINQTTTYQWYDCDSSLPIPGAIHRTFTPTQSGNYQVKLTTQEGCEAFSDCVDVVIVSTDNQAESKFILSPNPAGDFIQILIPDESTISYKVEVRDINGRTIVDPVVISQSPYILNLSNFATGVYMIKMTDSSGHSFARKFLKV